MSDVYKRKFVYGRVFKKKYIGIRWGLSGFGADTLILHFNHIQAARRHGCLQT
jgi:hypothetical protein